MTVRTLEIEKLYFLSLMDELIHECFKKDKHIIQWWTEEGIPSQDADLSMYIKDFERIGKLFERIVEDAVESSLSVPVEKINNFISDLYDIYGYKDNTMEVNENEVYGGILPYEGADVDFEEIFEYSACGNRRFQKCEIHKYG